MFGLTIYIVSWAVLAAAIATLALYRKSLALKEDDSLHISEAETPVVAHQAWLAQRMEVIDRWGKKLTLIAAGTGFVLFCVILLRALQESDKALLKL
jgi:hypothetical protein